MSSISDAYSSLVNSGSQNWGGVKDLMTQYGVDVNKLSSETGISADQLGTSLQRFGGAQDGFGGYTNSGANGWNNQAQQAAAPKMTPEAPAASNPYGGGGGGYSSSSGSNPYLVPYGDALTQQSIQQFNQGVLPQIRSGAQAAGQYGSSRQGIAEGVAAGNASTGLGANLANLYSQGYNTNQNYNLGLGGLALQNQSMNNNFYTTNRQLDQSGAALGNTLYNSGVNGQMNLGNAQYTAGNTFQNAPMNTLNQYSNMVNPYTGLNQSNTGTNSAGGGVNGAIGGAMTAAQLWNILNGSAK